MFLHMAAPNPGAKNPIRAQRLEDTDMDTPLNSETRRSQLYSRAVYINITDYAARTLDIEAGDDLKVETYRDRIVVRPEGDDAE